MEGKERVFSKQEIALKLETDIRWVLRGVIAIFNYQTAVEQANEATCFDNGVGFTGADAMFLSSIAKQLINGRQMSDKQLYVIKKRMKKYAGQLARIANGRQ